MATIYIKEKGKKLFNFVNFLFFFNFYFFLRKEIRKTC